MSISPNLLDRELGKFADVKNRPVVRVLSSSQFDIPEGCDAITRVVSGNIESWQYRQGGELGLVLQTINVTYAEPSLKNIISVVVA